MKKDFVEERHQKIVEYINQHNRANIKELADLLSTTDTTIRRDLVALEDQNMVVRVHGGVIKRKNPALWQTTLLQNRIKCNHDEKARIAEFVAQHLIHDGESLMIDAGSTTLAVACELGIRNNLLTVTNSPAIGAILSQKSQGKVILTGGELVKETSAMVGNITEHTLATFRTDKAIIGISGFLEKDGFFAAATQEAEIKRIMLQNASEKIVVADSSKAGTAAFSFICGFESVDKLVVDNKIDTNTLNALKDKGIEIFLV